MARLLSVNVGLPRDITWREKTVRTAVWKTSVQGRRVARRLNIDGDGQGDLAGHGGEHRAVLVYQMDSYRHWQSQLGRNDFTYGQFGENFTVDGLSDQEVCIGDRYRVGGALFEVTQPRVTCYRVGIRMNEPQMAALLVAHGRPGFYLRVLEEGEVEAGDEIVQVAAGPERMSVSEINALLYLPGHPRSQLERALRIPALSPGWHASLERLLDQEQSGTATGNAGLAPQSGSPPGWTGFRPLRVSDKIRESGSVTSLVLEPTDGQPLAAPLPGQFIVLRLKPAPDLPALLRSYSLSSEPGIERYRVSIKREPHGAAGAYIDDKLHIGDAVDASAPRGGFTLRPGDDPVVFLSAGIGATPVLAMLHALAVGRVAAGSLVAPWRPRPPRASVRRGGAHAPHGARPWPQPHLLQRARSRGSPGRGFRRSGTPGHKCAPGARPAAQRRLLSVRTGRLHERSDHRPGKPGRCRKPHPHGDFRLGSVQDPGHRRIAATAAAPAARTSRHGTLGLVRPQRSQCPLGNTGSEPPRACRSVRDTGAVGVPDRGLPHL